MLLQKSLLVLVLMTISCSNEERSMSAEQLEPSLVEAAKTISSSCTETKRAWERLAILVDTYGQRLSGSRALEGAIDWSLAEMSADGLENVRREKVMVPHWVRGEERARVVAPVDRTLTILGLGMTVGTGGEALQAPLVVVGSLDELDERADEIKGKVVLINQAMPPYDPETDRSGYGEVFEIRFHGPSRAAKAGAVAVLVRSLTARSLGTPHTGTTNFAEDAPRIPAAAVTIEDAEFLARLEGRGPVEVELFLGAKTLPDAESGNAIGELPGSERPEEIVVIGGHIDSWDVGDGSTDDGSGCVIAMEAARLLKELGLTPRRTIRVVLFTNEENGMRGAKAYHKAHGGERHFAAIEADSGANTPLGFGVKGTGAQIRALKRYAPLFEELGATKIAEGFAGVDLLPMTEAGVLGLGLDTEGSTYFDLYHSKADTFDKIDAELLQKNVGVMALMAYVLAQIPEL